MATAEALMELVPNATARRNGSQSTTPVTDNDEDKEKAMAATYAAYTRRAKMHAEKVKAQQLSRQIKTRLQFARLKVDYGWTRQSLNEVENLYFHLSRARPVSLPTAIRTDVFAKEEDHVADPSTPPTATSTPVQAPLDTAQTPQLAQPIISDTPLFPITQTQSLPSLSASPATLPFFTSSQPSLLQPSLLQPTVPQPTPPPGPRRTPFVERTRTGGLVRPNPPERLRTGGKVKAPAAALSPKKRGRPRIPDDSGPAVPESSASPAEGSLTYDSFWTSLSSLKTPSS